MTRRPRFTFLLNPGSDKEGELHRETRTGRMQNLGLATLSRDGWLTWGNGYASHLAPKTFRIERPTLSLTDRVVAHVLARIPAAMARAKQMTERAHDAPILSAERDTRVCEVA